jgi:plastocyanin
MGGIMKKLATVRHIVLASIIVALAGFGCGKKEEAPATSAPSAAPAEQITATLGDASITGKVAFGGTAPKPVAIPTSADPKCEEMHADKPLTSEEVIVNPNGTLRNVFVYVKSGLDGKTFPTPRGPVEIDQEGCHYRPHVFGMQAGQPLLIKNSDPTLHNIHAMPKNSKEFNLGQPNQGMETTRTFANPEVMVHFKCDVHPWMSAYCGVLSHPFYSVAGDDGTFALKKLPAGTYVVEAWHEKYGTQTQTVTVSDKESKEITFTFKAAD